MDGLQRTITPEEYRKDLQKLISLYEQLIKNNKEIDCKKRKQIRQTALEYMQQHLEVVLVGLDKSVPVILDGGAAIATILQAYPVATGLSVASTLWTAKNEGIFSVPTGVGTGTIILGRYGPAYVRLPVAIGQFIYDLF